MASTPRRKGESAPRTTERSPRRVKKTDAAPSTRDTASEVEATPPGQEFAATAPAPDIGESSTPTPDARDRTPETVASPSPRDVAEESAAIYPDTFDTPPTPEEIAVEAYNIYCQRGCANGKDVEDWLEAERRLSAQRRSGPRRAVDVEG